MKPLYVVVAEGTMRSFEFYGLTQARDLASALSTKFDVTLYRRCPDADLEVLQRWPLGAAACA